jgi:stress response protein YsnF
MALVKIKDFEPDYREAFGGYDIKGLDVYSDINNEKIGTVHDLLVDEQGHFRYFIVDLGFWGFGKKVMLPVDRAQVDNDGKHLYALGLHKDQIENLAEFNESLRIDDDRRRDLQESLRQPIADSRPVAPRPVAPRSTTETRPPQVMPPTPRVTPIEQSAPLEHPTYQRIPHAGQPTGYPVQPQPMPSSHNGTMYSTPESVVNSGMQHTYPQNPAPTGASQSPSILQRFEERLRAKRMQSG